VEEAFKRDNPHSWMEFYRVRFSLIDLILFFVVSLSIFLTFQLNAFWNVHILTIFYHRSGRSISGDFTVRVLPSCTVNDFLMKVQSHPQNRQGTKQR
jgi:hypothetical protein